MIKNKKNVVANKNGDSRDSKNGDSKNGDRLLFIKKLPVPIFSLNSFYEIATLPLVARNDMLVIVCNK
jgi:hypothetical protein